VGCFWGFASGSSVSFIDYRESTDGKFAIETHIIDSVVDSDGGAVEIRLLID